MRSLFLYIIVLINFQLLADTTIRPWHDTSSGTWEMYVLGGASVFFDLFTAVKFMVASGAFQSLAVFLALLGFFILMVQNVGGLDPKKIGFFFIAIFAASYLTYDAKVDLTIIDSVGANANDTSRVVTGVPATIGLPAAWISAIGEYFTNAVDSQFTPVDTDLRKLSFSNTKQLNMRAKLIEDVMEIHPYSPELTNSLGAFYRDCIFPMVANNIVRPSTLLNSNSLFAEIDAIGLSETVLTRNYTVPEKGGELMSCHDAWTSNQPLPASSGSSTQATINNGSGAVTLNKGYRDQITKYTNNVINTTYNVSPHLNSQDTTSVETGTLGALAGAVLSNVSNADKTTVASDMVKSRALARSFATGMSTNGSFASAAGDGMTTFLIEEQSLSQQTEGWRMAIETFNAMAIYIFTVLHAFIIGISPLILVLLFIPGVASKTILNYVQILAWLALWQPMLAIVNAVIVSFQDNAVATLLKTSSGNVYSPASGAMWNGLNAAIDKYTLAAGFLGTMVPMISWGLVKGGMAFSQFISSGIGTSVAQGAAKNLATGALSMDSKSFNNTSANKFSTANQIATGQMLSSYNQVGGNANKTTFSTGKRTTDVAGEEQKYTESMAIRDVEAQAANRGFTLSNSNSETKSNLATTMATMLQSAQQQYQQARQGTDRTAIAEAAKRVESVENMIDNRFGEGSSEKVGHAIQAQAKKNMAMLGAAIGAELITDMGEKDKDLFSDIRNGAVDQDTIENRIQDKYDEDENYRQNVNNNLANAYPDKTRAEAFKAFKQDQASKIMATAHGNVDDAGKTGAILGVALATNAAGEAGIAAVGANKGVVSLMPAVDTASKAAQAAMKELLPKLDVSGSSSMNVSDELGITRQTSSGDSTRDSTALEESLTADKQWASTFNYGEFSALANSLNISNTEQFATMKQDMFAISSGYSDTLSQGKERAQTFQFSEHLTPEELNEMKATLLEFKGKDSLTLDNILERRGMDSSDISRLGDQYQDGSLDTAHVTQSSTTDGKHNDKNAPSVTADVVTAVQEQQAQEGEVLAGTQPTTDVKGEIYQDTNEATAARIDTIENALGRQVVASTAIDAAKDNEIVEAANFSGFNGYKANIRDSMEGVIDNEAVKKLDALALMPEGSSDIIQTNDELTRVGEFTSNSFRATNTNEGVENDLVFTTGGGSEQFVYDKENNVMQSLSGDPENRHGAPEGYEYYGQDRNGDTMLQESATGEVVSAASVNSTTEPQETNNDATTVTPLQIFSPSQIEDRVSSNPEGKELNERTTQTNAVDVAMEAKDYNFQGQNLTDENMVNMSDEQLTSIATDPQGQQVLENRFEELQSAGNGTQDDELKTRIQNALGK